MKMETLLLVEVLIMMKSTGRIRLKIINESSSYYGEGSVVSKIALDDREPMISCVI